MRFSGSVIVAIGPLLKATVREELLKHEDEYVKLLLAFCFCEITRITMLNAPYTDDALRVTVIWISYLRQ
jgi:sister chromatid cohesion protein PDS5